MKHEFSFSIRPRVFIDDSEGGTEKRWVDCDFLCVRYPGSLGLGSSVANIIHDADLVLSNPMDIAKKLKMSLADTQVIIDSVCKELAPRSNSVKELDRERSDKFTTGDPGLDATIGGGIRTGMVWELVGERYVLSHCSFCPDIISLYSSSGKTQLALQLSLLVQIPPNLGGLSGAACYLTTNSKLVTRRLSQLMTEHPLLSPSVCGLSDIHTQSLPTLPILMHTLSVTLPALIQDVSIRSERKPLKLLIIDSLGALFHSAEKPTSQSLFERSKALTELSCSLHKIAARHQIAVVIINEVTDVFDHYAGLDETESDDVLYRNQARWFGCAHTVPGEDKKEAGLGLVWANQVNVRIMMSRTGRRRYMANDEGNSKRRRIEDDKPSNLEGARERRQQNSAEQPTLVRRLTVIFSSVSLPASVDYIVTGGGVSVLAEDVFDSVVIMDSEQGTDRNFLGQSSLKEQSVVTGPLAIAQRGADTMDEHYEAAYWDGFDDVAKEIYLDIDFDLLDKDIVEADFRK